MPKNGLAENPKVVANNLESSDLMSILRAKKTSTIESIISKRIEQNKFTKSKYPVTEVLRSLDKPEKGLFELFSDSFDALIQKDVKEGREYSSPHDVSEDIEHLSPQVNTSFHHKKSTGRNGNEYNIIHSDKGAGQSRDTFSRFLGRTETGESTKRSLEFTHGRMNRGRLLSTAASKFKLIASSSVEEPCKWTWTVVLRKGKYTYSLRDQGGNFLTYRGKLPVQGRGMKTHGTVIKLFDYDMDNPRDSTNQSFKRKLVKNYPYPPYRIAIRDFRYDSELVYNGVEELVSNKGFIKVSSKNTTWNDTVGKIDVLAIVRDPDKNGDLVAFGSNNDTRLVISECGQTHFKESASLVSSRVKFNNLKEDILIFARLREVDKINNLDKALFSQDRDRFVNNDMKSEILGNIYDTVNEMGNIKESNSSEKYKTTDPDKLNPRFPSEIENGRNVRVSLSREIPEDSSIDVESADSDVTIEVSDVSSSDFQMRAITSEGEKLNVPIFYSVDGNICEEMVSVDVTEKDTAAVESEEDHKISVSDFRRDLSLPREPRTDVQNRNALDKKDIPDLIVDSDIIGSRGQLDYTMGSIEFTLTTKDPIGRVIEESVREVLEDNQIIYDERDNSQLPTDYILYNSCISPYPVEIKAFDLEGGPNFDIGNFRGYAETIANNPRMLDSVYLIFGYRMDEDGNITVKRFWMKQVWEITGPSKKYPLSIQVKQGSPENIRPISWDSSKCETFGSRESFVSAIYESIRYFSQFSELNSKAWLKRVYESHNKLPQLSPSDQ